MVAEGVDNGANESDATTTNDDVTVNEKQRKRGALPHISR